MLKQNAPHIGTPFEDPKGPDAQATVTARVGQRVVANETRFPSVDQILNDINSAFEKRTSTA